MTENRLISTSQAAAMLREDPRTVQRKAKAGIYPAQKLPGLRGAYVFTATVIEQLKAERSL